MRTGRNPDRRPGRRHGTSGSEFTKLGVNLIKTGGGVY